MLGEIRLFYYNLTFFDKIIHLCTGILIAAIIYKYLQVNSNNNKYIAFLTVLGLVAIWEIYEYFIYAFFDHQLIGVTNNRKLIMPAYEDTIWDLIFDGIGAMLYLIFKREKIGDKIKKLVNR